MTDFRRVGDRVSVDHPKYPGVWVIQSRGPANSVLEPEGGGARLRVPHTMLLDPGTLSAAATQPAVFFAVGEMVCITEGRFAGIYAVIADKGGDKVNVALLGGDGGKYVRALRRSLQKIDAELLVQFLEQEIK